MGDDPIWEDESNGPAAEQSALQLDVEVSVGPDGGVEVSSIPSISSRSHSVGGMEDGEDVEEVVDDSPSCRLSRQQVRCLTVAGRFISGDSTSSTAVIPVNDANQLHWRVIDDSELHDDGAVVIHSPNYFTVCFDYRIPEETVAAKVNISRLETGRQWRDFLRYSTDPDQRGDLSLDGMLECPCCLGILRRPVALPCGHSLCKSCLMRLPFVSSGVRNCPLCRGIIPHIDLHVNEHLHAVTEALRAGPNLAEPKAHHPPCVMSSHDFWWRNETRMVEDCR